MPKSSDRKKSNSINNLNLNKASFVSFKSVSEESKSSEDGTTSIDKKKNNNNFFYNDDDHSKYEEEELDSFNIQILRLISLTKR